VSQQFIHATANRFFCICRFNIPAFLPNNAFFYIDEFLVEFGQPFVLRPLWFIGIEVDEN
jgi:hypothetical protein